MDTKEITARLDEIDRLWKLSRLDYTHSAWLITTLREALEENEDLKAEKPMTDDEKVRFYCENFLEKKK